MTKKLMIFFFQIFETFFKTEVGLGEPHKDVVELRFDKCE